MAKTWMAGTSPAMTNKSIRRDGAASCRRSATWTLWNWYAPALRPFSHYNNRLWASPVDFPPATIWTIKKPNAPSWKLWNVAHDCLEICTLVISSLQVKRERLIAACTFELFATDRAYELVKSANMPFRDTYRIVGAEVTALLDRHEDLPVESEEQLIERLKARSHLGGAGNLGLEQSQQRLVDAQTIWNERAATFTTTIQHLIGAVTLTEGEE